MNHGLKTYPEKKLKLIYGLKTYPRLILTNYMRVI